MGKAGTYMNILLLNGSSRPNGCTYTALREVADTLEAGGAETEIDFLFNGVRTERYFRTGDAAGAVLPYLSRLELVLVMSVEPGFGGQKFMPMALDKLDFLRQACAERGLAPLLEVDGGVDAVTGPQCVSAGANLLVAGSYLFVAKDAAEAARALKQA